LDPLSLQTGEKDDFDLLDPPPKVVAYMHQLLPLLQSLKFTIAEKEKEKKD
jgi:hypothetical protein